MILEVSFTHNKDYRNFLEGIKKRLKIAQLRVSLAVNRALIQFYWELGAELIEKQKAFRWGEQFLEQFSQDMRRAFPEMQGFSVTNLKRMRLFAKEYSMFEKSPQGVDQLPWGHMGFYYVKQKIA